MEINDYVLLHHDHLRDERVEDEWVLCVLHEAVGVLVELLLDVVADVVTKLVAA